MSQPIFLTTDAGNPNAATMLVVLSGVEVAETDADFGEVLILFDGRDADSLTEARACWKQLKERGSAISYWREGDSEGWERAR